MEPTLNFENLPYRKLGFLQREDFLSMPEDQKKNFIKSVQEISKKVFDSEMLMSDEELIEMIDSTEHSVSTTLEENGKLVGFSFSYPITTYLDQLIEHGDTSLREYEGNVKLLI